MERKYQELPDLSPTAVYRAGSPITRSNQGLLSELYHLSFMSPFRLEEAGYTTASSSIMNIHSVRKILPSRSWL